MAPPTPGLLLPACLPQVRHPPDEIAAEEEAEHEDEDPRAEDDHVDVERKVLETDGWHGAGLVGTNQPQATETPCKERERKNVTVGNLPPRLLVLGRPGWRGDSRLWVPKPLPHRGLTPYPSSNAEQPCDLGSSQPSTKWDTTASTENRIPT